MQSVTTGWVTSDSKPVAAAPLRSTWEVAAAAGEPVAVVRVRNLQGSIAVGRDAWGRANKPQPVLISADVSLARPFGSASAADEVNADTVHYGGLSKSLLGTLALWQRAPSPPAPALAGKAEHSGQAQAQAQAQEGPSSADVHELLWVGLTGRVVDGSRRSLPLDQVPFLDVGRLRSLRLALQLPKASLLGAGVSLATTACLKGNALEEENPFAAYARSLTLRGLHVPTLVGVNANERKARQMVVADVEIDCLDVKKDIHPELERLVFDTMEASSFETLEALGAQVADKILADFRVGDDPKNARDRGWRVEVMLSKPIALPFADCPSVLVRKGAGLG